LKNTEVESFLGETGFGFLPGQLPERFQSFFYSVLFTAHPNRYSFPPEMMDQSAVGRTVCLFIDCQIYGKRWSHAVFGPITGARRLTD